MTTPRIQKFPGLIGRVSGELSAYLKPRSKLVAALSGGVDSVVLLDVLHTLRRDLDFELTALHINHHLSAHSNEWAEFCRDLCKTQELAFAVVDIEIPPRANQEAAARRARHAVFAMQDANFVVLAHTLDDQVETLLLRLLRGAGAHGLAGMREIRGQGSGVRDQDISRKEASALAPGPWPPAPRILRPLLDVTRAEILTYAREHKLKWIEDESNSDTRFDRNFLRQQVLPLIAERWPAYRKVIARAARNLAESAQLLDELAALDSQTCVIGGTIALDPVKLLSRERATNLLRHFLRQRGLLMPDRAQLEATLSQLLNARRDASACAVLGEFALRRYRDRIHLVKHASPPNSGWCAAWRGESEVRLPYGVLAFSHSTGDGISLARLLSSDVTVRIRKGGERFHPDRNRPRRSLKNLLQENAIPPWQRERLPLLFSGETLVWAAGIGVDAKFQCAPREKGLVLRWEQ